MMTTKIKLLVKVAKRRMMAGLSIEEVLEEWKTLTPEEAEEIRKAVNEQ